MILTVILPYVSIMGRMLQHVVCYKAAGKGSHHAALKPPVAPDAALLPPAAAVVPSATAVPPPAAASPPKPPATPQIATPITSMRPAMRAAHGISCSVSSGTVSLPGCLDGSFPGSGFLGASCGCSCS
jgi:hypothetical protein